MRHAWAGSKPSKPAGDPGEAPGRFPGAETSRAVQTRPLFALDNVAHRKVRVRVEHVIGRMKNYEILRDCRQHGDGLHHAVQAVARMHNLALTA